MTDILISIFLTTPPDHSISTSFWQYVLDAIQQSSLLNHAYEALATTTGRGTMAVFRSPNLTIDTSMLSAPQVGEDNEGQEQFLGIFFGVRLSHESQVEEALKELIQKLDVKKGPGILSIECRAHRPYAHVPPEELAPTRTGTLLIVYMTPSPESDEPFNKWYDEEHIPMLSAVPGWLSARRYVLLGSTYLPTGTTKEDRKAPKYLAVHEMVNNQVFERDEYKAAVITPWRAETMASVREKQRSVMEYVGQLVDLADGTE